MHSTQQCSQMLFFLALLSLAERSSITVGIGTRVEGVLVILMSASRVWNPFGVLQYSNWMCKFSQFDQAQENYCIGNCVRTPTPLCWYANKAGWLLWLPLSYCARNEGSVNVKWVMSETQLHWNVLPTDICGILRWFDHLLFFEYLNK